MVLHYKASHTDLGDLTEMEEGKEKIKDMKQVLWNEVVSVMSEPPEVKSTEDEDGVYEESQKQEGKEEDSKDESTDDACPEASEESNPLKLSESKKVTTVKGWIEWEVGSGLPQVPLCGGVTQPEDGRL